MAALSLRCSLCFALAVASPVATAATADEPGTWHAHRLEFYYLGTSVAYSCQGLATELHALLGKSGAQQITVTPAGPCGGARTTVMAQLAFSTLEPLASGANTGSRIVAGTWHHVTLSARDLLEQGGECELVQQFRNRILPLFSTRHLSADLNCVPFQSSGYLFSLSFDVFAPGNANLSDTHKAR